MTSQYYVPALLLSPFSFFSRVEDTRFSWQPSLFGYFFCALGTLLGYNAVGFRAVISTEYFLYLTRYSLLSSLIAVIAVGLVWMWGGARLLGGRASLTLSLKATGFALAWPGIVASTANLIIVLCGAFGYQADYYVIFFFQISIVLWLLLMLGACVRGLNRFGSLRTLAAVLLPPLLGIRVGLLIYGN